MIIVLSCDNSDTTVETAQKRDGATIKHIRSFSPDEVCWFYFKLYKPKIFMFFSISHKQQLNNHTDNPRALQKENET